MVEACGGLRDTPEASVMVARPSTWLWEVWNEPDIAYWHGTPAEYDRLYDVTAAAVRQVLPEAKIGGPEATGVSDHSEPFLRQFLEHCAHGDERGDGRGGSAARLHQLSPQRASDVCRWACRHEYRDTAARGGARHEGNCELPGMEEYADHSGGERSGGMRCVPERAERLSQRATLWRERDRGDHAHV